ncbi:MAG: 30S ribosomal protein S12 methylthiotransferase RimO [Dehalococcoidia bacterium]|nr:30S ribosomal protein S12 methylthiotransferase RimO [Dehalococcoidia bacterium]
MKNKTFHIISLGCAKNTVDADSMATLLSRARYQLVPNPKQAHLIIINTCGFINIAKDESYSTLEKFASRKKSGQVLIATGCLTQRYGGEVQQKIRGVDAILGTRNWMDIVELADSLCEDKTHTCATKINITDAFGECGIPRFSIQGASAYLKIADGCSRACAFCAIPSIKGPAVSHPMESILAEAKQLQECGIREIILIAQNSTDYGYDLGMRNGLANLLTEMTKTIPNVDWLRIMYAYPGFVTDELIEVMATHKQIVPYLDMPLQHAHPDVLRRMHRPANIDWVYKTLDKMRNSIPNLALRSTFIVGYPDESEREFQTLLDFIDEIRFDKLGAFKFSFEAGTPSEALGDTIPEDIKEDRTKLLMEKQQKISLAHNKEFIGKQLDVLVEGMGDGISIGRSYRDAPEVDGLVLIKSVVPVGEIISVRITEAMAYDMSGVVDCQRQ